MRTLINSVDVRFFTLLTFGTLVIIPVVLLLVAALVD
jgi:hypothetical protein